MSGGALYLGFDYGLRRIGIAVGDDLTGLARPLATVDNGREPAWPAIDRMRSEWRPRALVVGLPVDLDGHEQAITGQARAFAQTLGERYGLPVHLVDERMSSRAADDELRQARADGRKPRRLRKGERDSMAARLILEQFLGSSRPASRP